ncbi:MAG: hypothetical protein IJ849_08670 [Selenomonadaceae bacterium]|nr:hypothetical protein [Selenomonadaceae bacterium]
MDDYTWQQKLDERHAKKRREGFFIFLVLAAVIGTGIWYWFIYTRTPLYALEQAQHAIEKQDGDAFRRYVNLDLLTAKAYDDLTLDLFAYDATLTPQTKVMFEKFYMLIKPQMAAGTAATILDRVENGEWSLPTGTEILKGRQLGIDYERFLERSQIRNTSFVSLGDIQHQGTTATAVVNVLDEYTDTPFTLQLVLEESETGDWQVAYVQNYKDYLNAVAPLQNKDLTEYIAATAEIVTSYNEVFRGYQAEFQSLAQTGDGELSENQREALAKLIEGNVIPALKKRQQRLNEVPVPKGAAYLAKQRADCTEVSISAWQHFILGLKHDNTAEYDTAESLHKLELEIDLRVEDIIRHTAVSRDIANP